jgi:hypothetical protein
VACQGVVDPVGLVVLTTSTSEVQRMSSERCGGGGYAGGMSGDGRGWREVGWVGGCVSRMEGVFHASA